MQLPQPGPRDLRSPTALSALAVQVPLGPCESTTAAVAECHSTGWAARATGACSHTVPEPRAVIRSPEALGPSESSLLARRWAPSLLVHARSSLRVRRLHPSLFLRGQSLNSGLPLRRFQLHYLLRGPVTDTVTSGSRRSGLQHRTLGRSNSAGNGLSLLSPCPCPRSSHMCDLERWARGGQARSLSKADWVISESDISVLSHGGPVRGPAPGDGHGAGTSSSSPQPPGLHLHPDSGLCQPGTQALASSHIWGWPGGLPRSMATQGDLGFFPSVHHTCTWTEVAGGAGDPHVWPVGTPRLQGSLAASSGEMCRHVHLGSWWARRMQGQSQPLPTPRTQGGFPRPSCLRTGVQSPQSSGNAVKGSAGRNWTPRSGGSGGAQ